jgi:DNA-binding winged helix-turn-helix (wHTH) protein/tetratricopeptide (TPR) repeat protein
MSLEIYPDSLLNFSDTNLAREEKHSYRFKAFELIPFERQLLHSGNRVPLTPKAFEILILLVENAGHLVKKEEIIEAVWADAFVEEANLARLVHTLRKTLGEDENGNKFIETVAKQGYRFVTPVTDVVHDSVSQRPITDPGAGAADIPNDLPENISQFKEQDLPGSHAATKGLRRPLLAGLAILVTVALSVIFLIAWNNGGQADSGRRVTIAVLPFRPIDVGYRKETYDLGFADSMIYELGRAKDLTVRQLSAIRQYQDLNEDAVAIGRIQKVEYVVDSNYLIEGGRIRVTLRLINVGSGAVEETLREESDDVSDVMTNIDSISKKFGNELIARLRVRASDIDLERSTTNEDAYRHYLQGMYLTDKRIREDAEKAITEFESAIRLQPDYARAWVGLAYAQTTVKVNDGDADVMCPGALDSAQHALSLDPNLAEAYTIIGMNQHSCTMDQSAADAFHRRAVELAPNSSFVHRFYGIFLSHMGRADEAIREIKTAIDLDPNLPFNEKQLGRFFFLARRYDEAIVQLKKVRELDPRDPEQLGYLFMSYQFKGDYDQALEWFLVRESVNGAGEPQMDLWKATYRDSGWEGVLKARLERAEQKEKTGANNFAEIASLAAQVGDKDKAFAYAAKAISQRRLFTSQFFVDPTLDPLRSDPRYGDLLKRVGM